MILHKPALIEQSPLLPEEATFPIPGAGDVRVRVRFCGVCHTDLHIAEGDLNLPRLPIIPGHQIVGIVDAVGQDVQILKAGDRVGIPWLHFADGTCEYCRRNLENLCPRARFTGYHEHGGYAEYTVVPADFAVPLPQVFADQNAAPLLCAGIIGYRAYRMSGVRSGDRLGLYGFGASAHLVLQIARFEGCEVSVFTRAPSHRELAEKLGAAWTGSAEDAPPHPLDASIIFAPAGLLVPLALKQLRKAATLVLAGITMTPIPQLDYSLLYQERVIRSVANSTRHDTHEFLQLAARVPVQTEIQVFDLEQANLALQALKHSEIRAAAVLRI